MSILIDQLRLMRNRDTPIMSSEQYNLIVSLDNNCTRNTRTLAHTDDVRRAIHYYGGGQNTTHLVQVHFNGCTPPVVAPIAPIPLLIQSFSL